MSCFHKTTPTAFLSLFGLCLIALTTSAQADPEYVYFSNDAKNTILWTAVILAGGMIVSALILRKSDK